MSEEKRTVQWGDLMKCNGCGRAFVLMSSSVRDLACRRCGGMEFEPIARHEGNQPPSRWANRHERKGFEP